MHLHSARQFEQSRNTKHLNEEERNVPKNEKRDMLCQEEFMFSLLACNVFCERLARLFAYLGCLVCLSGSVDVCCAPTYTLNLDDSKS